MTNRILLLLLLPFWCTWYISLSQDMAINRQGAEDLLRRGYSFDLANKPDSALICFRRAADVFCEMQVWESARYCLNGMGRALIRSGKFTVAFSPLKRARELPVGQSQSDRVELAKTFELTGYVHSYQDQADSAMLYLKEAVTIRERYFAEDHVGLSQSLYLLGVVTLKKGTPEDALVHLQRALRIEQRSDRQDHRNLANILIATGNAFEAKGEYVLSIRFYSEALSTVGEAYAAPSPAEAACHFYLGESYRKLGEYGKAVDHLQTALRINRDLSGDISQAVLSCHKQLGDLFLARGDWDEALASYHACLSLIAELNGDRHSSVGDIYCNLSMVYREKGEPDTALVYSLRALDIQQSALGPNHPDLGFTLEAIGSIHAEKHDYAASLLYYHAALSLRRSVSTPEGLDIAAIASRIGSLYSRMGTADSAEAYLGNALRIIENTPGEGMQLRSRTLRELGEINCRRGDLAGGLFFYNEAIAALSRPSSTVNAGSRIEFDSAIELVAIRKAQADAFARSYENTHALSDLQNGFHAFDEASRIIGRQRRLLRAEGSKFAIEEQNISLHEQAAGMALELYRKTGDTTYLHAAHETVERNKAGVLLDALRESNARHFAGIPDSLIARERILRGQLAQCAIEMQKPGALGVPLSRQQHNDLVRRQLVLNNEFHQLVESFRDRFPEYYDLQFDEHLVSGQVQVPGGCTLLQYFVGEKSLFIFTMRGNELDAQVLPKPREFEGLISSLRSSIKTIDPNGFVTSSTALYSLLIKPVEHHLTGSRHIIVVPDGPLYAVPFEALVSSVPDTAASGKRIDFVSLPYLIKSFDVSYAYSARSAMHHVQRPSSSRYAFLGVAPVFTDSLNRGTVLADNSFIRGRDSSLVRSITVDGRRFNQLPFSEDEVHSVASSFTEMGNSGRRLMHGEATEEQFKNEAGKYAFIHIATHGVLDEEHPNLSALLFAPPADSAHDDGILYAAEAYTLHLNADLVVLSSCESGMGKLMRGEGMLSMTRGFFYAGARNVMFSLWKVYDRHTRQLMVEFYDNIHRGLSFSSSLQKAKLKLISSATSAFPAKWAGFVLLGSQGPHEASTHSGSLYNEFSNIK